MKRIFNLILSLFRLNYSSCINNIINERGDDVTKTIVISAVNLVVGGTLTILRDNLAYLSEIACERNLRIIAIVYDKNLALYSNIEYVEIKWAKKMWINRLWCEYFYMKKISCKLSPVYLWFSLHDTTPNVLAEYRAVYCHNSFPFYRWTVIEIFSNYKVVLFALFSKYVYKKNIKKNDFVIVQQDWFKKEFIKMFDLDPVKMIVAYPIQENLIQVIPNKIKDDKTFRFFFPSSLSTHKNFELVCKAAKILENRGIKEFEVYLTIDGSKNKYDSSIYNKYRGCSSIKFIGFQSREKMLKLYSIVDCLIFPSKVESWGLPISEFAITGKPMLLSDLPYARTASIGSKATSFFNPYKVDQLQKQMEMLIQGDTSFLSPVFNVEVEGIHTSSWDELYGILLK